MSDRLPCDRSGTSDSSLSAATTWTGSPAATVASGQSSGSRSVEDTTVSGLRTIHVTQSSRTSDSGPSVPSMCTNSR